MKLGYIDRLYSGTAAASSNTQSAPIYVGYIKEATFLLDITAITGTLDIEIQTYNALTNKWHKLAEFSQKSSTGKDEGFVEFGLGTELAVKYTVSSSSTFSLDVLLK